MPGGTIVTFVNPADNAGSRGVTKFFEGQFGVRLEPGQSFTYTFDKQGEYFFNDPPAAIDRQGPGLLRRSICAS